MRLKERFSGEWQLVHETRSQRKADGIITVCRVYSPIINGKVEGMAYNPGSGRPLVRKRFVAINGERVSCEHETRKAAIAEVT